MLEFGDEVSRLQQRAGSNRVVVRVSCSQPSHELGACVIHRDVLWGAIGLSDTLSSSSWGLSQRFRSLEYLLLVDLPGTVTPFLLSGPHWVLLKEMQPQLNGTVRFVRYKSISSWNKAGQRREECLSL